ncbi:MAG: DUF948 domain-containing protein [Chlamydiales bacterium]|nr:DUF948 domain-containing protein [Chlamydiia bacterium]MCP5507141.1 DUF948 domain-containing protein [Chlamydiales bacterium]
MSSADIYLSLAVLGIIVLSICVVFLTVAAVRALNAMAKSLNSLDTQINNLENEPKKLLYQASELSENINHKMRCLDPLFHSVSNIGERFEERTGRHKEERELKFLFERLSEKQDTKMDQALDIATIIVNALDLFHKCKKGGRYE